MLVKLRLVLISTMMMDLQHHHGVWKTLAVFTVVLHVYLCSHFCFFLFLFFHHESFTLVIASSLLYHNFFSCFYIFVILAFHSITTSFLFLQVRYHHISLHCNFFSCFFNFITIAFHSITTFFCFCNFVTTAFHCHSGMLLSRMDIFIFIFQATKPLSTIGVASCWSCKSQVSIINKSLFCCIFIYLLPWTKCKKGFFS